ncbi:MAG: ADP-glyceromanno-heptose 6-epimerase [Proteobacteria bacterium]|nr:ADP-glyceromanno-heptose 6-epimerase [Pseudomonadota bacterium]
MIVVTGGAGFIGSNLVATLEEKGYKNIVVCDEFGDESKWRNLAKRELYEIVHPDELIYFLENNAAKVEIVFHMGAISSTTETDVDLILENNFNFPLELWKWCVENKKRMVYASSAATYGDGSKGFKDDHSIAYLKSIKPLNPYGWSKNLFDIRIARAVEQKEALPPQWVGLKFFNVYGPNESHKGEQMSVLRKLFPHAEKNLAVKLFRSENKKYGHGEQLRDFVYVKDCCEVMVWLMENPKVNGLFNVGTGKARTFKDLANSLFKAVGQKEAKIDFIDMPVELIDKYQYITEASMDKLKAAGYNKPFTSLEEGAKDYVQTYLKNADQYR